MFCFHVNDYIKFIVMTILFIILHILAIIIVCTNAETRTYQYRDMCTPRERIMSCSFQIPSSYPDSCLIYNTDVCKNNEFTPWVLEPLSKPKLESDTEFTAVIEPYAFYTHSMQRDDPVSAINISLTSFSRSISGFTIIMNRITPPREVCRIIDFRNSMDDVKIPFHFFYDCFHKLREDFWKNILITFRAYPLNIEITYLVYIPRVSGKKSDTSCAWTPLVMIYHEGLLSNHIQLKFSNPQNDSNILFFVVTLFDSSDIEIDKIRTKSNTKNDMIYNEFQSVEGGYYSVSVSLILPRNSCLVFKSDLFLVGAEVKNYSFEIFVVLVIIMIVSAFVLTYYLCQRYLISVTSVLKPRLLLVYFHKQLQHEFLLMWAEYLEKHHGVNAYTLYKCGGNPKKWLDDITSKSNIIVFVISEGLARVFDEETSPLEEDHYWVEQLPEAKALINSLKSGEKIFCKICFPFSEKQHIPKCLKQKGPLFRLLGKVDETEDFLCYIFNCSSKFRLLNKICCIKHHVVKNADSMQKDVKDLKDKLKKINEIRYDVLSDIDVAERKSQSLLNKQLNSTFQNDEKSNKIHLNSVYKNSDVSRIDSLSLPSEIIPQDAFEDTLDAASEENNSSVVDYENKNTHFYDQSENVYYEKNELLRFWLRKAVNFER